MKRRNDHFFKEKEFIRLKQENSEAIDNYYHSGWIQLEKPLHDGYNLVLGLRDDISRRDDAWEFQYIINNFTTKVFSNSKEFDKKISKRYRRRNPKIVKPLPGFRDINKKTYESLPSKIQRHFRFYKTERWVGDLYMCILPKFYFVNIIEKHFITRIKVMDEQAMKDLRNIESELTSKFYNEWYNSERRTKFARKYLNRVRRKETKITLRVINDMEDLSFEDNYKDARWF